MDECFVNPCENGASCHDKVNAYECECTYGYTGVNCTGGLCDYVAQSLDIRKKRFPKKEND